MQPHKHLIILLTAAILPKAERSPKQQSVLDATFTKLQLRRKSRTRFECQYCSEQRLAKDFINSAFLPWGCQPHLTGPTNRVCKSCLEAALSAQLDCKPLLDIGCPQCGTAWEPDDVRMLMGGKDGKRFREIDKQAQTQIYVPEELPDAATLDDMLARGARLCPGCRFPFIKLGGCESILCASCGKYFNIAYAPVLEDGKGHRAVNVGEDSNADIW